jgi:hypothetical protein
MKGFPIELIVGVLFGAAMLLNFVMQRAAKRQRVEPTQAEPLEEEIPEEVWRGQSAAVSPPAAATHGAPSLRAEGAPATPHPRAGQRRFDRRTLLGTRRRVQDAFVVATILGRCRGEEPHEIR